MIVKKLMILTVVLLLIITNGCKGTRPEIDIPTVAPEVNVENIVIHLYRINIDKEDELPGFNHLLQENFGIEIVTHSMSHITEPIVIANLNGLLYFPKSLIHEQLDKKEEKFLTLNEFLKNNEIFNSLPKQLRYSLEDENGNIWYIPQQHLFFLDRRIYNERIMVELGLKTPETLNELIETFSKVKSAYGDEVPIMEISPDQCTLELKDILEYYGVRIYGPNVGRLGIIGWDSKTERFEDTIYNLRSEEFFDTIDFMRMNHLFNLINDSSLRSFFKTDDVFSSLISTNKQYTYMSGPLHKNKEYIFNRNYSEIFVPLGTSNPEKILNTFIDTFYGSNKGNIIGLYGESGKTVIYDDSYSFVFKLKQDEFTLNSDGNEYRIGVVEKWINNDYLVYFGAKEDKYLEEAESVEAFRMQLIENMTKDTLEILAPYKELYINGYDPVSKQNVMEVNKLFQFMLFDYLSTGAGREDFIDEYIKEIKKTGMEDYINAHNEMIGVESLFRYTDPN